MTSPFGDGQKIRNMTAGDAHGYCQEISERFVEFCKSRGLENIYATNTDIQEMGYTIQPGAQGGEIGFDENEEMQYGHYKEHTVNTYYPPGGPHWGIVIDFTAMQYGYSDLPKISSLGTSTDPPCQSVAVHGAGETSPGSWAVSTDMTDIAPGHVSVHGSTICPLPVESTRPVTGPLDDRSMGSVHRDG